MLSGSEDEYLHSADDVTLDESSDSVALIRAVERGRRNLDDRNEVSKVQELRFALDNFKADNQQLREQLMQHKAREMEITAMMVSTQERWNAMGNQIATLKLNLQAQLQSPISEEEYYRIEQRAESERDLVDAVKIGVYRQIGVLKVSRDAALKNAAEQAVKIEGLEKKAATLEQQRDEKNEDFRRLQDQLREKTDEVGSKSATQASLQSRLNDAEHRLQAVRNDREQYYDTKMQLAAKTNECMRLELSLKEADDKYNAARTETDCLNEKLDILKSEYYEAKLQANQRVLELESQLRATEEKMSMLKDLELEAEVFMNNIANSTTAGADGTAVALPFDAPVSRRLQHSLSVTKRALLLENQVVSLKHELKASQSREEKLTDSLRMTKAILSDEGHPYALVEESLKDKDEQIVLLNDRISSLLAENSSLEDKVVGLTADVSALTRHRRELSAMKQALQQLPFPGASPKATTAVADRPRRDADLVQDTRLPAAVAPLAAATTNANTHMHEPIPVPAMKPEPAVTDVHMPGEAIVIC